jgi:hypothetical protein
MTRSRCDNRAVSNLEPNPPRGALSEATPARETAYFIHCGVPDAFWGQLGHAAPSMCSTLVVRRKPGMKCSITSEFTVPLVVSGRFLNPSK